MACQPARFHDVACRVKATSFSTPVRLISGSSDKVVNFAAGDECNRFYITEGDGSDKEAGENEILEGDDNNSGNYFPWRHESQPTKRLLEKNDFSGMPNNFRARLIRRLVSCRELNISLLEAIPVPFFVHTWETELVDNFKAAFMLSVSELLSSIFQTPVKNEHGVISIDSRNKLNATTIPVEKDEYLNRMLDKNLLTKYQSVNANANKLRLKLSIRPIEATLEHIFTVSVSTESFYLLSYVYCTISCHLQLPRSHRPLLSRDIVERKPYLKGGFQKIENAFSHQSASYSEVKRMTIDLANEIGGESAYRRTVIADVTIKCIEFLQVKDDLSGTVLQGMGDECEEEEVIHVVRFEVVTQKSEDGGRVIGNWKIIDIDDLLHGNVFH